MTADKRRIDACLKACEGISTQNLEDNVPIIELARRYNVVLRERDALRAKIKATGEQEPVAQVGVHKTGGNAGIAWSARPLNEFDSLPLLREGDRLYLAPGAQPKLDEIKIALHRALELGKRETWTGAKKYRSREDQCEEQQCWDKVWNLLGAKGE